MPETLIQGGEREFWEIWIKAETWTPTAISDEAILEWSARLSAQGGLRGCLATYRAGLENSGINKELKETKLTLPIHPVGVPAFVGPLLRARMLRMSEGVERCEVFGECGHSSAWEAEDRLARMPHESMLERKAGWVSMPAGAERGRAASPLAPRVQ